METGSAEQHLPEPISNIQRTRLLGQQGLVVWFTGLSGAGKTTIAMEVERKLLTRRRLVYLLDGDLLRQGLNAGLGFSQKDRMENIRRAAHVARILQDAGVITLACFISPRQAMRDLARQIIPPGRFLEVYVKAGIETCMSRDPKGHYKRVLAGEIRDYTGMSREQRYEVPSQPDLELDTEQLAPDACALRVIEEMYKINEPPR
jgi:adenylyl-sulfate kinase